MAQGDLNPTSFMILGLLASRDWSAYEIAEQVGRGVSELWPRADRQRYNAPKRLLERGLVTSSTDPVGTRRSRTVYSITPAGREALATWLATTSRPPALEFEGMIRVIFADQGSVDDLRDNIETMREQARTTRGLFVQHANSMLAPGGGTFPERLHLNALANRFMIDHLDNIEDWADWALHEIESWPDTVETATTERERSRAILEQSIVRARSRTDGHTR